VERKKIWVVIGFGGWLSGGAGPVQPLIEIGVLEGTIGLRRKTFVFNYPIHRSDENRKRDGRDTAIIFPLIHRAFSNIPHTVAALVALHN
jgi:hypothetical protein